MFENMKKKINMKIEENKSSSKRLRDEEKANNEERLRNLNSVVKGREPDSDNSTEHPTIKWGDDNLLEIFAGTEQSKFGRKIAVSMFGGRETSLLKTHIIGPVGNRKETRIPIVEEHRKVFES